MPLQVAHQRGVVPDQVQDAAAVRVHDFLRQIEPEVGLDRVRQLVTERQALAFRGQPFVQVDRARVGMVHPVVVDPAFVICEMNVAVRHAPYRVPGAEAVDFG
jgi:hypothetical protein